MAKRREPETARIESMTHDGRGIAAVSGKKVFVPGALQGELVRFQRRKRRRKFDEAELLEVLQPASQRIEPRCAAFGTCGGCSLQHISADQQREIKQSALARSSRRNGWRRSVMTPPRAVGIIGVGPGSPSKTFSPKAGSWWDFANGTPRL